MDIVVVDSLEDTREYPILLEGISDASTTFLYNPTHQAVRDMMSSHMCTDTLFFGHGTANGILNEDFTGRVLDRTDATSGLLAQRKIIGIWCYAAEFADEHKLHGFFTSMFISNIREAREHRINAGETEVRNEFKLFLSRLNYLIKTGEPMENWVDKLKSEAMANGTPSELVRFNYEGLTYFE